MDYELACGNDTSSSIRMRRNVVPVMRNIRLVIAFILSLIVTVTIASVFYTQQVIAGQMDVGAVYTSEQQADAYFKNFVGLAPAFGGVLGIGLAVAFLVAAQIKRALQPLAPIAYPIAGAVAVVTAILLIEGTAGAGGVGAIGGARDATGLALQGLAGFIGGAVFALTRGAPTH
jgi:uncharacterized membrane protein